MLLSFIPDDCVKCGANKPEMAPAQNEQTKQKNTKTVDKAKE